MRVFLDTNVLVAAFATRGLCADVLRTVLTEHELVLGEVVLSEFRRALRRKLRLPEDRIAAVEAVLSDFILVPRPARPAVISIRDKSDRWILASAIAGNSDVLVTGDQDRLEVAGDAPLPILSPREFWDLLRRKRSGGRTKQ